MRPTVNEYVGTFCRAAGYASIFRGDEAEATDESTRSDPPG